MSETIHRPPPAVTSEPVELPPAERVIVDGKPRFVWPSVFRYRWTPEGGQTWETAYPPPPFASPKRMESGVDAIRPPYEIIVFRPASYEALLKSGVLQDPQHWGEERADAGTVIDIRKAPGA